jgi:hypothetical protein
MQYFHYFIPEEYFVVFYSIHCFMHVVVITLLQVQAVCTELVPRQHTGVVLYLVAE